MNEIILTIYLLVNGVITLFNFLMVWKIIYWIDEKEKFK